LQYLKSWLASSSPNYPSQNTRLNVRCAPESGFIALAEVVYEFINSLTNSAYFVYL